jgi:hypothetical protein
MLSPKSFVLRVIVPLLVKIREVYKRIDVPVSPISS